MSVQRHRLTLRPSRPTRQGKLTLTQARGGRCHLTGRSLRASMPFARSMLASLSPSWLRSASNAGSIGTGHPSRTRIPLGSELEKGTGTSLRSEPVPIEAPRREPVRTAGRWAIPAPGSPQTVHHQPAQSAFTINQPPKSHREDSLCRSAGFGPGGRATGALATRNPRAALRRTGGFCTRGSVGKPWGLWQATRRPHRLAPGGFYW